MSRREILTATAIIAYYIASVLGHLEVSLWLVQRRESELVGTYRLADFLPHAGALLLAAVVIWQTRRAWRGCNHGATLAAWAAWLAAVIAADRFLIYSFPEYLHYPQYALLAFLIARFHEPDRTAFAIGPVLLAVTVLGIADESLQYTWITISYSKYLDFNDFLLNLLGGAAGLLLYYGFAPGSRFRHSRPDPESSQKASAAGGHSPVILDSIQDPVGHKTTGSRVRPGMTGRQVSGLTVIQASTRYGLLGFAWLGTAMLLIIAVLKTSAPDADRLPPIERQPSYNTWIPGPHAGRYYVLDPVTGTLILIGLGTLGSATPLVRRNPLT